MLNCEHMRPLYDLDVSYYPPWISWHNLNCKKRVLQFQHWLTPPKNWFRFKYTTKLDSAWEKYTYRFFFFFGGGGETWGKPCSDCRAWPAIRLFWPFWGRIKLLRKRLPAFGQWSITAFGRAWPRLHQYWESGVSTERQKLSRNFFLKDS